MWFTGVGERPTKIAKHIGAVACDPCVSEDRGHGCGQFRGRVHNQIGGPLALPKRPVVRKVWAKGLGHGGERTGQKAVEQVRPPAVQLLVQKPLCRDVVFDVQELVALAQKVHMASFKPAAQPFPSIKRDLNMIIGESRRSQVQVAVFLYLHFLLATCDGRPVSGRPEKPDTTNTIRGRTTHR